MRHATRQRHLKHQHKTTHYRRNCYFHSCNPHEHAEINQAQPYAVRELHKENFSLVSRNQAQA